MGSLINTLGAAALGVAIVLAFWLLVGFVEDMRDVARRTHGR
jgi:hypothetical protein